MRPAWLALALAISIAPATGKPAGAAGLNEILAGTAWGETDPELLRRFGARATVLSHPLDFGDSYVDVVIRDVPLGGYPVIAYFQMDQTTGRLKRIQLERPRRGVTPQAFRAALTALEAEYGAPDTLCGIQPAPASGYQGAVERIWRRGAAVIRAIFRDTTIEAFECVSGVLGTCGLTAQLLIRISPESGDSAQCPAPPPQPRPRFNG
jgi:hypothetical protein